MPHPDQIRNLQDTWDELGRKDPMWAIASSKDHWDEEEFFSTGAAEIEEVIAYVDSLGLDLPRSRALDFGCGLGRLTRALGAEFEETVGVDIAPSMVAAARELNEGQDNLTFVVNEQPGLDAFDSSSFDLVYSNIVLQHMAPELAKAYIRGFLRVISDRGLVLFQLPSRRRHGEMGLRARLRRARRRGLRPTVRSLVRRVSQPTMEMHCVPKDEVVALLESSGAEVIDIRANANAGPLYESYSYAAVVGREGA
jgi:SAM-dependent methyltransferase